MFVRITTVGVADTGDSSVTTSIRNAAPSRPTNASVDPSRETAG
jgi:hypothetical protein